MNIMPASIAEPDIRTEGLIKTKHPRNLTQLTFRDAIAGYARPRNGYHIPDVGTLAYVIIDRLRWLSVAELSNLADYEDPVT
jgi:hypothetical protein